MCECTVCFSCRIVSATLNDCLVSIHTFIAICDLHTTSYHVQENCNYVLLQWHVIVTGSAGGVQKGILQYRNTIKQN